MSAPAARRVGVDFEVERAALGELQAISRAGGQGRVYVPVGPTAVRAGAPVVVKLYRRAPPPAAGGVLGAMVRFRDALGSGERAQLDALTAWPQATVRDGGAVAGIVMGDVRPRFEAPFLMPSGRQAPVLLSLEHLLGADDYLRQRGLPVALHTTMRARVAERITVALAFLHRHGIAACDIAPNNLLIAFAAGGPEVCFIDCDSMVFHGRRALVAVETGDWQIPAAFGEPAHTRAADAYKLGLVVLRLFARSHDARDPGAGLGHVPRPLRPLLDRALGPDAANRPPAGEWQRALQGCLAAGGLDRQYPGPPQARLLRPLPMPGADRPARGPAAGSLGAPAAALAVPPPWRAGTPPLQSRRPAAGARSLVGASSHPGASGTRRPAPSGAYRSGGSGARRPAAPSAGRTLATMAWVAIAIILFVLVFSRLFAAAVPGPSGGFDGGLRNGAGSGPPPSGFYQPAYPGGYDTR